VIKRVIIIIIIIIPGIIGTTGIVTKSLGKSLLGTAHIIRKVLQCETGSLSGGGHRWFKGSAGEKARDKRQQKQQ
jgi:hypothetical protein